MSRLKRIARILASFSSSVMEKISDKYRVSEDDVQYYNDKLKNDGIPNPDTVTEWIFINYQSFGIQLPEDYIRLAKAATFFYESVKTQKWRDMFKNEGSNYKNLFSYDLHTLEQRIDDYNESANTTAERERINKLDKLPEGAELVYNKGGYQAVQIKSKEAACELARGTKWCTSDGDTAGDYLDQGLMFVLYKNGKKFGQAFFSEDSFSEYQIMDLWDRTIPLTPELAQIFVSIPASKNVFLLKLLWKFSSDAAYPDDLDQKIIDEDQEKPFYTKLFMSVYPKRDPSFESILSQRGSPRLCYSYALYIVKGRWEEGELSIASRPYYSYLYAKNVLHGRFPLGELKIELEYSFMLRYIKEVIKGRWPEVEDNLIRLYYKRFQRTEEGRKNLYFEDHALTGYLNYLKSIGQAGSFFRDHAEDFDPEHIKKFLNS